MNNYEKMREALEDSNELLSELAKMGEWGDAANCQIADNKAALAEPLRNCDVGTAEEQAERMDMFCKSHGHGFDGRKCYACENCNLISVDRCELTWAQMPYVENEGGAK